MYKWNANKWTSPWDLFYWRGLTWIPGWIINYTHYKVCDKITYPLTIFKASPPEVQEWICNFIPNITVYVITYPCWNFSWTMLVKWVSGTERSHRPSGKMEPGDLSKNAYELLKYTAFGISTFFKNKFQCRGKIFCVEFQEWPLNSTQNIFSTHWKMYIISSGENLGARIHFRNSPLV